ncbi:MAG: hypothetical protein ACYCYF_08770, partial [Anaerolineae bacterium]
PAEHKPADGPWHDHMGIVLSCEGRVLRVAEGNRDNLNRSAVVERRRDEDLGYYVRFPDGTEYDGWQYDYKTHAVRVEPFSVAR